MLAKQVSTLIGAIVTTAILASAAQAAPLSPTVGACVGLDCPGILPATSAAHSLSLPSVAQPRDLETTRASGFYVVGAHQQREVAYVAAPGRWAAAPAEIKQLPVGTALTPTEISSDAIVVYGPGSVVTVPPTASALSPAAVPSLAGPSVISPQSASSCPGGWFCLFDSTSFNGVMGKWQSTGSWQNLSATGWTNRARSMVNNRNAWTLLAKGDGGGGARYCAKPNSQDASLASNGFDQNTASLYNSTSQTKESAWNCSN
jgi:hypothetical protein